MNEPLLILGGGGHASVLVDILRQQNRDIVGVVTPSLSAERQVFKGILHFSSDDDVLNFNTSEIKLVNGIGSLPQQTLRTKIYEKFSQLGYEFETVIDHKAVISSYAKLGDGVQIMAGAIVQTGAIIGNNCIINTGAIIEHDCNIGEHNHIAPRATLSGQVKTKNNVHVGTGASVIQSVTLGERVIVGAGAAITQDIAKNSICFPARTTNKVIKQHES